MTLILVVTVPLIVDHFVQRYIEDILGGVSFLSLSSEVVVNLLVWMMVIGPMLLLGAGGILKRFGVIGIIGLIVAYWILGDVTNAIIPIVTLAVVLIMSNIVRMHNNKKSDNKG